MRQTFRLILFLVASGLLAVGYASRASAQLTCSTPGTSTAFAIGACLTIDNTIFSVETYTLTVVSNNSGAGTLTNDLSGAVLEQDGSNFGVEIALTNGSPLLTLGNGEDVDFNLTLEAQNANTSIAAPLSTIDQVGYGMSGSGPVGARGNAIAGTETISGTASNPPEYSVDLSGSDASGFVKSAPFTNTGGTEILSLNKDIAINSAKQSGTFELTSITQDLIPVPEPGTIGVFSVALAGLIAARRRKG